MRIRNLDELDPVNDGRVLLGTETGIIGKTDGKLSDIIGDAAEAAVSGKVDQYEYDAAMDGINDELDAIDDAISNISANYATTEYVDNEIGMIGSYTVAEGTDEGPTLEPSVASEKVIYLVKDEGITGTDQYREWIVTENEQEEKVWTCIGDTTIDLSDYALSADVDTGLALKENKIFIAEYNRTNKTSYADIKAAYDAGKQIFLLAKNFNDDNPEGWSPYTFKVPLTDFYSLGGDAWFKFSFFNDGSPSKHIKVTVNNNDVWSAWSNILQDKLTFAGENNTITSINSSAIAQPDLTPYDTRITQLENTISNLTTLLESYSGRWVLTPDTRLIIDGKVYNTITIGSQEWTVENLEADSFGGVWYNNDENTYKPLGYGKLYTWQEVNNITLNDGWRVPSVADFETLYASLENTSIARKLKSSIGWNGNDTIGFNILPAGYWSNISQNYVGKGTESTLWTTDSQGDYTQWCMSFNNQFEDSSIKSNFSKTKKCSVRLVRDIT